MNESSLQAELELLRNEYKKAGARGLKLDMSRGVQGEDQLAITEDMLRVLDKNDNFKAENGIDCRNYGLLDGIPEVKRIFAQMLEIPANNIIVCGNSSLNIMYDTVARSMLHGVAGTGKPWLGQKVKFLCPVPGYDRHFAICESFGIELINVPMKNDGPDMDMVEELVSSDESIKGIWCVPKYSNPDGIVYSDEVIKRFAALKPAASDFRIFWDNAYVVHALYGEPAVQISLFDELKKNGAEDMLYIFASTSKISFPGSGIAVIAASDANIEFIKNIMKVQTIGHDKLNQLRHARYFGSLDGIIKHMEKHASLIRPKFECVLEALEREFTGKGIASWTKPQGGYFISLNLLPGTAKRTYQLMSDIGVKITPAGATYPYGKDPEDSNLRLAPTYPPLSELSEAINLLCLCAKIACIEKILAK